jgi:hypothetical protein
MGMSSHLARSLGSLWHRILLFLAIRDEFDWAPPALGPEVNHPYMPHSALRCCEDCGGGCKHAIHRKPYDARRVAEIMAAVQSRSSYQGLPDPFPTHAKRHGYVEDGPEFQDGRYIGLHPER